MRRTYKQLSPLEREEISLGLATGKSLRSMAQELGRSPSTLSREVRRNGSMSGYRATTAEHRARKRSRVPRRQRKLASDRALWRYVRQRLRWKWSPEQIAMKLRETYPDDVNKRVSPETIYATVYAYPRGEIRQQLLGELRQSRKYRRSRRQGKDRRGQIPNMKSIHERPLEIESRKVPGHWEGDLIKGTNQKAAIGTLVERTTRLTLLVKLDGLSAEEARKAFTRKLNRVPSMFRKSLTYDRGKEMSEHEKLSEKLKIDVYFADPRSPWQRATCENTNGLIRQFFPRGMNLVPVTQAELTKVEKLLNERPRKGLKAKTPYEAWEALCQSVAL